MAPALRLCVLMLLDISNGAAGHDHDLALYRIAQGCKIFRSTEAVDEDIFVVTSNGGDGTVHIASLCRGSCGRQL